jgi:phage-related protein
MADSELQGTLPAGCLASIYKKLYILLARKVPVLHAFEKKTQRTARADIDRGRQRLNDVLAERRSRIARARRES